MWGSRSFFSAAIVLIATLLFLPGNSAANQPFIYDISWPNCDDNLQALRGQKGIVGVLGGLNFHKNPCLDREAVFQSNDAYLNTGYPGLKRAKTYNNQPRHCAAKDEKCLAYNYGWAAADYAAKQILFSYITPKRVWLDVEFGNTWSDSANINRIVISGMHDRLQQTFPGAVGVYSYPFQWKIITSAWRNGWPAWEATGSDNQADAAAACNSGFRFTGGPLLLAQYTPGKYDQNLVCQTN